MKIYRKAALPIYFKASGVACGIKKSGKLDLGLFYSGVAAKASLLFTANKIQAAPIQVNKRFFAKNKNYRAIIVNSGNANCFTGWQGIKDAEETARVLAGVLGIRKEGALLASTGIIGRRLPVANIKKAIPELVRGLSVNGLDKAKKAIKTTDTFDKEITVKFNLGRSPVTICGIAKGAGMIAPDMATMLCFILTDANITQRALDKALKICVDNSFNCITVDGCMSTNDSVMLMANGASACALIDVNSNFNPFLKALKIVCLELAKMVVRDAEGATKFIQINVNKAGSFAQARKAALAIANSSLFKTAMYGKNPNFGRIVSSVGASGIEVEERKLRIRVSPLHRKNINVDVYIGRGNSSAVVYTSDLTPEYIKINAEYS